MYLNDDPQYRVAKNPMQCAQKHALIFQELESRSCHGYKVMDTVGEPLALSFQ